MKATPRVWIILSVSFFLLLYQQFYQPFTSNFQVSSLLFRHDYFSSQNCTPRDFLIDIYGPRMKSQYHMNINKQHQIQTLFDQGIIHIFGYNYLEGRRNFEQAIQLDPTCSMCYFGLAYSYGPTINEASTESTAIAGREAIEIASNLSKFDSTLSSMQKELIRAALLRFPHSIEEWRLNSQHYYDFQFSQELKELYERYPEDSDIAALYAESIIDLSPWNYYNKIPKKTPLFSPTNSPLPNSLSFHSQLNDFQSILSSSSSSLFQYPYYDYQISSSLQPAYEALHRSLSLLPTHPLSLHLLIHLTEQTDSPSDGLQAAQTLQQVVGSEGSGHLIHMPAHTYMRMGLYEEAVQSSMDSVALDEKYSSTVLPSSEDIDYCSSSSSSSFRSSPSPPPIPTFPPLPTTLIPYGPRHNRALLILSALHLQGREYTEGRRYQDIALNYSLDSIYQTNELAGMHLSSFFPLPREMIYCRLGLWKEVMNLQEKEEEEIVSGILQEYLSNDNNRSHLIQQTQEQAQEQEQEPSEENRDIDDEPSVGRIESPQDELRRTSRQFHQRSLSLHSSHPSPSPSSSSFYSRSLFSELPTPTSSTFSSSSFSPEMKNSIEFIPSNPSSSFRRHLISPSSPSLSSSSSSSSPSSASTSIQLISDFQNYIFFSHSSSHSSSFSFSKQSKQKIHHFFLSPQLSFTQYQSSSSSSSLEDTNMNRRQIPSSFSTFLLTFLSNNNEKSSSSSSTTSSSLFFSSSKPLYLQIQRQFTRTLAIIGRKQQQQQQSQQQEQEQQEQGTTRKNNYSSSFSINSDDYYYSTEEALQELMYLSQLVHSEFFPSSSPSPTPSPSPQKEEEEELPIETSNNNNKKYSLSRHPYYPLSHPFYPYLEEMSEMMLLIARASFLIQRTPPLTSSFSNSSSTSSSSSSTSRQNNNQIIFDFFFNYHHYYHQKQQEEQKQEEEEKQQKHEEEKEMNQRLLLNLFDSILSHSDISHPSSSSDPSSSSSSPPLSSSPSSFPSSSSSDQLMNLFPSHLSQLNSFHFNLSLPTNLSLFSMISSELFPLLSSSPSLFSPSSSSPSPSSSYLFSSLYHSHSLSLIYLSHSLSIQESFSYMEPDIFYLPLRPCRANLREKQVTILLKEIENQIQEEIKTNILDLHTEQHQKVKVDNNNVQPDIVREKILLLSRWLQESEQDYLYSLYLHPRSVWSIRGMIRVLKLTLKLTDVIQFFSKIHPSFFISDQEIKSRKDIKTNGLTAIDFEKERLIVSKSLSYYINQLLLPPSSPSPVLGEKKTEFEDNDNEYDNENKLKEVRVEEKEVEESNSDIFIHGSCCEIGFC